MDKSDLYNLQELAASGRTDAIIELVNFHLDHKDYKNAFLIAQRFEYFICPEGYKILGNLYQNGYGTEVNISKAISCYEKGYKIGNASSGYQLALLYIKNKDYLSAIKYLSDGVYSNHLPSIKTLAKMYQFGEGVGKNGDIAINLYKKAIELGDAKSIDLLARMYYSSQDFANSFFYFSMGATRGDLDSIYHLGLSHAKGLGTRQDFNKAFHYYQIGANQLEPRCLYNLSLYYRNGIVVNQNIELANKLEKQAYQNGFKK